MHRLIRRLLGMGPSPSEVYREAGRVFVGLVAQGLQDPRPLTADEMAELMAYTGGVAQRSFSALYDDEDRDVPCWRRPGGCPWPLACDEPVVCAARDLGADGVDGQ